MEADYVHDSRAYKRLSEAENVSSPPFASINRSLCKILNLTCMTRRQRPEDDA